MTSKLTPKKYIVVHATDYKTFESTVNSYLDQGYKLLGELKVLGSHSWTLFTRELIYVGISSPSTIVVS